MSKRLRREKKMNETKSIPTATPHVRQSTETITIYHVLNKSFNTLEHAQAYADEEFRKHVDYLERNYSTNSPRWNEETQTIKRKFGGEMTKEQMEHIYNTSMVDAKQKIKVEAVQCGYFSELLWSDVIAYEIVNVISDKTVEIRQLEHKVIWKDRNLENQRGEYKSNEAFPIIRIRAKRNGRGWVRGRGTFSPKSEAYAYYDYRF